jgi:O-antigen/teichoic acid export membrane protein
MLARKSALIVLTRIITALFSVVSIYFVAHYMGPTPLGIIGYANGLVGLFSSSIGFDTAHYKRASEGKDLGKCVGTYIVIKIILACFLISLIIGGIFVWKHFFGGGFESQIELVIYIVLATTVIMNLSSIFLATFGARRETAKQEIPSIIAGFVRMPIIVTVAIASLGVLFLAGAYLIAQLVILMTAILLFRGYPIGKPSKEYLKSYTAFALPAAIGEFAIVFSTGIDKVMIQHFCSFEEVGFYVAIYQMIYFFMIIPGAVGTLLLPTISEYHSKKDFGNIKRVVHASERYLSMLILPIIVLIFIFSKSIILIILGETFLPSANILILLSFMLFFAATTRPYGVLIEGINRPIIAGKINLFSCIMNVLLNVVFIPEELGGIKLFGLGAVGAALAMLIAWIIRWMLFHISSYKLIKIKFNPRILLHFIAGILMGIILYTIKEAMVYHLIYIIPLGLLGIGCYFGILHLLKEFKKEDLYYLLDVVNPKKMGKYVKKEIKEK